jgi:hypothetical protein
MLLTGGLPYSQEEPMRPSFVVVHMVAHPAVAAQAQRKREVKIKSTSVASANIVATVAEKVMLAQLCLK